MSAMFPHLFTPLKIGSVELRNRIVSTGHDRQRSACVRACSSVMTFSTSVIPVLRSVSTVGADTRVLFSYPAGIR